MAKNHNRGNRDETPREALSRNVTAARNWAGTPSGRGVLAGIAATVAGLLLSRDRRVRDAATSAGRTVRDAATEAGRTARDAATDAAGKVRSAVKERTGRGREVGDDLAEPFEVPTTGRTDTSAGVIAH